MSCEKKYFALLSEQVLTNHDFPPAQEDVVALIV
jgi:hypothetical protein